MYSIPWLTRVESISISSQTRSRELHSRFKSQSLAKHPKRFSSVVIHRDTRRCPNPLKSKDRRIKKLKKCQKLRQPNLEDQTQKKSKMVAQISRKINQEKLNSKNRTMMKNRKEIVCSSKRSLKLHKLKEARLVGSKNWTSLRRLRLSRLTRKKSCMLTFTMSTILVKQPSRDRQLNHHHNKVNLSYVWQLRWTASSNSSIRATNKPRSVSLSLSLVWQLQLLSVKTHMLWQAWTMRFTSFRSTKAQWWSNSLPMMTTSQAYSANKSTTWTAKSKFLSQHQLIRQSSFGR